MKINWRAKLSSRKFWAAVGAWITSVLAAFNVPESAIAQTGVIVAGIGALAVYILAEAYADGKNAAVSGDEQASTQAIGFSVEQEGGDTDGND